MLKAHGEELEAIRKSMSVIEKKIDRLGDAPDDCKLLAREIALEMERLKDIRLDREYEATLGLEEYLRRHRAKRAAKNSQPPKETT
jgi:hypothetical protein